HPLPWVGLDIPSPGMPSTILYLSRSCNTGKDDMMRTPLLILLAMPAMLFVASRGAQAADAPRPYPAEEAALLKNAEAFVEALHKGDAKALAALWTPDGDYTSQKGRELKGRDAIEKAFSTFFAENKGLKLRIDILGLRFVTPDVAVEDGMTSVIPPDNGP